MLSKKLYPILAVNILALLGFSTLFFARENYEFILYIAVIVFFLFLILFTNKKIGFSLSVLWGLTIWGILHMSGGGMMIGDHVLYAQILLPISESYQILKYDQLIHAYGFGLSTLVVYELLKPLLKETHGKWVRLGIVIVMAGTGLGALNEVIEFFATVIMPETGVGGYVNTGLDLVFNLIGATIVGVFILRKEKNAMLKVAKE